MKEFLTDDMVKDEIERLTTSPYVKLARAEQRMKYRQRQYLYQLRNLEKRGKALMEEGITEETLGCFEDDFNEGC